MSRIILTEELLEGFYNRISPVYPHLSKKEIERICRAEFQLIKDVMQKGELEEIRLQYLFVLRVSPQKIIKQLTHMKKHRKVIRPEKYQYYLELILNHVNKEPLKFRKYESKIKKITGFSKEQITNREYLNNGHSLTT